MRFADLWLDLTGEWEMRWRPGTAYSQDLRDRVFARCDAGEAVGEIAEALCVSISYVSKVLSRRNQTGELSARPQRCHVPPKLAGLYTAIEAEVKARPDATLAELCRWLSQTHHVTASSALMHGTLRKLGLTHKKRRFTPPNKSVPMSRKLGLNGAMANPA
jgi:transposase